MIKYLMAAAPLALLAACSSGGEELQAGEWEMTTQMTDVQMEGMPEEMMAAMREQMLAETQTDSRCITEEEAADPSGSLFAPEGAGSDCDFGESAVEGGVININATCQNPAGQGEAQMSIEGTYTATTMEAEFSFEGDAGGMGAMTMTGEMTAERTGECDA